jgi:hypothetical protein
MEAVSTSETSLYFNDKHGAKSQKAVIFIKGIVSP